QIATLGSLTQEHPALADGAQVHRYASADAGVYAFSRIDADELVEYVVVANNATEAATVSVPTYSSRTWFSAIYGDDARTRSGTDARLTVEVEPLSVEVYRAGRAL